MVVCDPGRRELARGWAWELGSQRGGPNVQELDEEGDE